MKVLIIEDDKRTAAFIADALKQEGYTSEHIVNGRDGLMKGLSQKYDVAIIDIMLPEMDGLSIIKRLRAADVTFPVLILSARSAVSDRVRGLKIGGDDYLVKPFAFSELLARLESLVRRGTQTNETKEIIIDDLRMDLVRRKVYRNEQEINLQPLEFSLLEYLMRNKGRVISRATIMEHIWEYNFDPQTNIVDVRICRLREKIDKNYNKKLIHTVRGCGYVFKN